MKYEFKTEPYDHQRLAFEASCKRRYYGLFMEMGTGKSKVTIDTIGYLFLKKEINTVLIVAPKGVFDNWVKQEIPALARLHKEARGPLAAQHQQV